MPVSAQQLTRAGKASLDWFERNPPEDQIQVERPWLAKMRMRRKRFPGAKQNIVVQLRTSYGSNFQWYYGDATLTYNRRDPLAQAFYPWRSCHDGFSLNEDDLAENGIAIDSSGNARPNRSEISRLTNILNENLTALKEGFDEKFDAGITIDGASNTDALTGLDALVPLTPTTGKVGNIDRSVSANAWWRPHVKTGLTQGSMIEELEDLFLKCQRNGGAPDFIMVGTDWLKQFRAATKDEVSRYTVLPVAGAQPKMDPGTGATVAGGVMTGLAFKTIPILWNPVFQDLDAAHSPATAWEKRGYLLNCRSLNLSPIEGYDRNDGNGKTEMLPPVYDRRAFYWRQAWKGALTMRRSNCNGLSAIN